MLGYFNFESSKSRLSDILIYLIITKEPTCFKALADLHRFVFKKSPTKNTVTKDTSISDFHKMVVTVLNFFN